MPYRENLSIYTWLFSISNLMFRDTDKNKPEQLS